MIIIGIKLLIPKKLIDSFNKSLNLGKAKLEAGKEFGEALEQCGHHLLKVHWLDEGEKSEIGWLFPVDNTMERDATD